MDPRPIGVFDSGIGGLTVLKELLYQFPNENFIYLGDTARLPYGSKSGDTIKKYSVQNLEFLKAQNVKAFIIACNSASTQMQEDNYKNIPLYNVIGPGAEEAVRISVTQRIGVVGTRATVLSKAYENKIKGLAPQAEVFTQACPLFVPLAEEGWIDDPITNLIVYRYLKGLLQHQIDTLVLACTHYPILKNSIARATGNDVKLLDSGEAIARKMQEDFKNQRLIVNQKQTQVRICMTDSSNHFIAMAEKILLPFNTPDFEVVNL